jgi:hypothetical protein
MRVLCPPACVEGAMVCERGAATFVALQSGSPTQADTRVLSPIASRKGDIVVAGRSTHAAMFQILGRFLLVPVVPRLEQLARFESKAAASWTHFNI